MTKIIVDTGIFYALLDKDDRYHQQAQAEMHTAIAQKLSLYAVYPVIIESYSLILYRLGFETAQRFLKYSQDCITLLNPTPEQYEKAQLELAKHPDQKITLVEAITATVAAEKNLLVWSYDFSF